MGPVLSAFRLYSIDVSCEEDDFEDSLPTLKIRGSYRKYTQEEKEIAVSKVYSFLFRFSMVLMSNKFPKNLEYPGEIY